VELHTLPTSEPRTRRATRAGGMSLAVRTQRKEEYIPCMMTNNSDWERGWFYLRNAEPGLPPTLARCSRRGAPPGTTGCPRPSTKRDWIRSWPRCRSWRAAG
jgi:hypothetical protein